MLFEPTKAAGLGIRPAPALLQAGVVAVEHLSAREKVWVWKYTDARVRHPLLPNTKAGATEWQRVLREVDAMDLEAPAATSTATRHGEAEGTAVDCGGMRARCGGAQQGRRLGRRGQWSSTRMRLRT